MHRDQLNYTSFAFIDNFDWCSGFWLYFEYQTRHTFPMHENLYEFILKLVNKCDLCCKFNCVLGAALRYNPPFVKQPSEIINRKWLQLDWNQLASSSLLNQLIIDHDCPTLYWSIYWANCYLLACLDSTCRYFTWNHTSNTFYFVNFHYWDSQCFFRK